MAVTYYKLSGMTVAELRQHCSESGVEITYKMKKSELIDAILEHLYRDYAKELAEEPEYEKEEPQMSARIRRIKEQNR